MATSARRPPGYPAPTPVSTSALPDVPRTYQQMLRGRRYRWWKPLLCLLLVLLLAFFMMMLALVPVLIAGWIIGADLITTMDITNLGPIGFIYLNLSLIVLIPASGLSIWIVHGIRPKFLSSVAGGIRWRWLLRCIAVILPLWAIYIGLAVLVTPFTSPARSVGGAADHCAAPDAVAGSGRGVLSRGWIMQNVGAWFCCPHRAGRLARRVGGHLLYAASQPGPMGAGRHRLPRGGLRAGGVADRWARAGIVMHAVNNMLAITVVYSPGIGRRPSSGGDHTPSDAAACGGGVRNRSPWSCGRPNVPGCSLTQPAAPPRVEERPAGTRVPPHPVRGNPSIGGLGIHSETVTFTAVVDRGP